MTTRPLLYLVTDRHRLAATLGRPSTDAVSLVSAQITGAIAGGIDYVQIREEGLDARELTALAAAAVRLSAGTGVRIVVNDRADAALAASAHGVHLRESSYASEHARRLNANWVVGRSVHSAARAAASGLVDYLIAGTVFPTPSKPGATDTLGEAGLADIVRAAAHRPVVAIGGVRREDAGRLFRTGARGAAAIGAFIPSSDTRDIVTAVHTIVREWRFAFDSTWTVP